VAEAKKAQPTIAGTLSALRKSGAKIGLLTEAQFEETLKPRGLSTGNLSVDAITSIGGLPRGRVTELFGPPSSGKTTTALQAAALVQRAGRRVVFMDHERSLDERYLRALGVDPDLACEDGGPAFVYMQPRSLEEGANAVRGLLPFTDLVITDSVAAMVTENELEAKTGKAEFAARAKAMHQYMRQVTGPAAETNTALVFLNHVQEVIDTSPMGQQMKARGITRQTTPGGTALKFYASLRMSYKQIGNVRATRYDPVLNEEVSVPAQTKTLVTVVKNKVGNPFGQAEVRVRFGTGFSNEWSALDVLVRHGVVKKDTGGVFRFRDDTGVTPTASLADEGRLVHAEGLTYGTKTGLKDGTTWWVRGEDAVIALMERDAAFGSAATEAATKLIDGQGWDQKASEEEIAAAKAEESDDASTDVPALPENQMGDTSDLEQAFA